MGVGTFPIRLAIVGAAAVAMAACVIPAPVSVAQPSPIVIVVTATPGPAAPSPVQPTPIVVVVTATPDGPQSAPAVAASTAPTLAGAGAAVGQVAVAANQQPQLAAIREVATLRTRDILQRTKNVRAELRIAKQKIGKPQPPLALMPLADALTNHWVVLGSYGLGTDPYYDRMPTFTGGSLPPIRVPTYGLPASTAYGLPRLLESFLSGTDLPAPQLRARVAQFEQLVEPYSNPGAFPRPLRDAKDVWAVMFSNPDKAQVYVGSAEYAADLDSLDRWYAELEAALAQVPGFFPEPVNKGELS